MKEIILKHGGARPGSGRKPKYDEPTTSVSFAVPISHVEEVKKKVFRILKKLEKPNS